MEQAYKTQKNNARSRGIEFTISFEDWCDVWNKSGHWKDRGRGRGKYVMSRIGDTGGYELSNVFIQTYDQNMIDGRTSKKEKKEKPSIRRKRILTPEHRAKIAAAHSTPEALARHRDRATKNANALILYWKQRCMTKTE